MDARCALCGRGFDESEYFVYPPEVYKELGPKKYVHPTCLTYLALENYDSKEPVESVKAMVRATMKNISVLVENWIDLDHAHKRAER